MTGVLTVCVAHLPPPNISDLNILGLSRIHRSIVAQETIKLFKRIVFGDLVVVVTKKETVTRR